MAGTVPHPRSDQKSAVIAVTSVTVGSVVRLAILLLVAACSFEHGRPVTGGSNGAGDNPDASTVVDVAPTDVTVVTPPMDAPPCADADTDGVCDDADDWPCGAKPAAPGATLTFDNNNGETQTTITGTTLDNAGRLAVATPQENLSLRFDYDITDTACQGNCIDQIEIGWVPGGRAGCAFDGQVSKQNGESGTVNVMIRAPNTKQVYDLRVNLGQNFSCNHNGANTWWNGTPAATKTIAKLCVH
jgi:hypothetical protein